MKVNIKAEAYSAIDTFPEPLKALAIKRTLEQSPHFKMEEVLQKNINDALYWSDTEEGHAFWFYVCHGEEVSIEVPNISYEIY